MCPDARASHIRLFGAGPLEGPWSSPCGRWRVQVLAEVVQGTTSNSVMERTWCTAVK